MNRKCKISRHSVLAVMCSAAALASLALPMMSVYCADGENGTILVRIFNLAEFGIVGFMPMVAPLLLIAAVFIRLPQKWRRVTVIGIIIADALCTAIAAKNAYVWLAEISAKSVRFHPICVIYGLMMIAAVLIIALSAEKAEQDG